MFENVDEFLLCGPYAGIWVVGRLNQKSFFNFQWYNQHFLTDSNNTHRILRSKCGVNSNGSLSSYIPVRYVVHLRRLKNISPKWLRRSDWRLVSVRGSYTFSSCLFCHTWMQTSLYHISNSVVPIISHFHFRGVPALGETKRPDSNKILGGGAEHINSYHQCLRKLFLTIFKNFNNL